MTFQCPRCARATTVTVTKDQATVLGGCQHVEFESVNGAVSAVYLEARTPQPRDQTISAASTIALPATK